MDDSAASQYFHWEPHPFIFQISEGIGLRYYGLAYVLGFVIGGWLLKVYHDHKLSPFDKSQRQDIFLYIILGVALGGRLGYFLFYQPFDLIREPWVFFQIWKGGMASHGGFIGIAVTTWWISRKFKQPFWHTADLLSSLAPAGLFLGRIANFLNGELWGNHTAVKWAVVFTNDPTFPLRPRHPSQIYEALLEGLLLLIFTQWRIWKTDVILKKPGRLVGEMLLVYSLVRIFGEQFREPDAGIELTFGILSRGSTLSILMGLFAVFAIWRSNKNAPLQR